MSAETSSTCHRCGRHTQPAMVHLEGTIFHKMRCCAACRLGWSVAVEGASYDLEPHRGGWHGTLRRSDG